MIQKNKKLIINMDYFELILILGIILYIFFWSLIDILRMLNLMDSVFDAGIISLTLNSIIHEHYPPYILYMSGFSLLRILFSPLILIDGIPGMLVIQEIFLALPAYVLFKI